MAAGDLTSGSGDELAIGAPFADAEIRNGGIVYIVNLNAAGFPADQEPPTFVPTATLFPL
jgi:hypothetical protein